MTHPFELTIARTDGARQHLPRGRRRGDHVHPGRPLLRGPVQAPGRAPRCARCSSSAPRTSSCCATAPSARIPVERAGRRRPVRRPARARRSPPTAWSTRAPPRSTPRCSPASRCRSRSARATPSSARTVNAGGRLVVRATRVGADTQLAQMARLVEDAQNGKAEVQRLADRISGDLRAGRDRARRRHARLLARHRRRAARGVHRRGRRADHRLPVRARAGHADRADGRHRPRRPARHPDQGPRGAGVHPPGRHRRARQDRHRHHRPDDPARRRPGRRARTPTRCCGWPARWRTPPSTRSPRRSPRGAAERIGALPPVEDFAQRRGPRRARASSTAHAVVVGRRRLLADWSQPLPAEPRAGRRRRPRPPGGRRSRSAGTAPRAASSSSPTRSSRPRAEAVRAAARLGLTPGPAHRRQRGRRPHGRRRGRHRRGDRRGAAGRTRSTSSRGCRPRAASWPWSATASTTPPRSPRPTSGSRWAPAPTSRSRPAT